MTIRTTLKTGDISFLLHSHAEYYHRELGYTHKFEYVVAKSLVRFYEAYDPARSRIWMVENDAEQRIGSLVLQDRGTAAQLSYFMILPAAQGKGLGRQLLESFFDFARQVGYKTCYLMTTEEQAVAVRLYEAFGFRLVAEKPSQAFGRPLMDQRFEVTL